MPEAVLRASVRGVLLFSVAVGALGCEGRRVPSVRAPSPSDDACAQVRASLQVDPATLRAQRTAFRERVTARFGPRAFEALRASYGGRCADDADLRCALQEAPPLAFVECVSPSRNMPEALFADGPTLRRADGVEAFTLAVRSAGPEPSQLVPLLDFFQRITGARVLRDRASAAAVVPAEELAAMPPTCAALLPPTLAGDQARFVAYEDRGYQAPRALLEVHVDFALRTATVVRAELARRPYPQHRDPPRRVATVDGSRYDGTAGAVCAWGEHRGDRSGLPRPASCRAGLSCCSGGAAGSDGICERTRGGDCPLRP